MIRKLTTLFPLWAVAFSIAAYLAPGVFAPLKIGIVPLLGLVMFGMGMTLTFESFGAVLKRPLVVLLGTAMQFGLMPLIAWLVAQALGLPRELAAGLILVGSCPGGTASNVVCYLAKGDVALSITLTSVSTLLAFLATPLLTWLYIGHAVHVPVVKMILSILKIVIVPVLLGVTANRFVGKRLGKFKEIFPLISVLAIVVIIAIIVALNRDTMTQAAGAVILAVILHNGFGLAAGYGISRGLRLEENQARTLAIEVGMQNSGLGVALAMKYFSAAAALPGALFSIWHNLTGSLLAAFWSRRGHPHRR